MQTQVLLVERAGAGAVSADAVRAAAKERVDVRVVRERRAAVAALAEGGWAVVVAAVDNELFPARAVYEWLRQGGMGTPLVLLCDDDSLADGRSLARSAALELVLRREEWMLPLALTRALVTAATRPDAASGARPAEDWSRRVLDQLADGVVTIDAAGRVSFMNVAAKELYGLSRARTVGLDARMLLPNHWPDLLDEGPVDVTAYRTDGSSFVVEMELRRATLLGQQAHVATLRDVAQRRALERQLQQAQRLDAVAHLATGFSHEFNNILTGLLTYTSLVRRDLGDNHSCAEDLAEIEAGADRAAGLVRQLQTLASPPASTTSRVDVNEVVERTVNTLVTMVGPDIDLEVELGQALPRVLADPDQVAQVLNNLVLNARDALPDGGRVAVATRLVQVTEARRGLLPVLPGAYVAISVEDSGEGMDATTMERCFDPFFTTRPGAQRSGLGLPIAHAILRQHGGSIDVDSAVGQGTRVQVSFPVNSAVLPHDAPAASNMGLQGTERILLAEDDEAVRGVIERILENNGYSVVCVEDGVEALSVFTETPKEFDGAVVDLLMPRMGGIDLYDNLARLRPDLPVLWVSGFSAGVPLRLGTYTDFLAKPFNPIDLVRRLRALLDRAPGVR